MMFYIYWILMMISLITSFAYLSKSMQNKHHLLFGTSLMQCILSVSLPFLNLLFVSYSELSACLQDQFSFLWMKANTGNATAFIILMGYLVTFMLVVLNGKLIFDRNKKHSISI